MISMMMSALAPPAAATATTISVVLNVTNKEVESGLTRETRRLENLQRPCRWFVVVGKASLRKSKSATDLFVFLYCISVV